MNIFRTTTLLSLAIGAVTLHAAAKPAGDKKPYLDATLPIEQRVDDLMSRMSLHDKVLQLQNNSHGNIADIAGHYNGQSTGTIHEMNLSPKPVAELFNAITRYMIEQTPLGIPPLPSAEGIHGVIQEGATIYPQAIALGATFNPALIEEMTAAEGDEARAMGIRQFLSPVLDIARELRWGRVEETYGEDPYLIGRMATAFVRGAQSSGVGCMPKHFLAHGTPVAGVNTGSVAGGPYDLYNLYARPFAMVIRDADPVAIMSCYSSYDGVPVSGSRYYMTDLLRGELGFKGFVYSDWGAVDRLKSTHHTATDDADAARQALIAGIDMDVADWCYTTLEQQVLDGRLDEKHVDTACRRVLTAKFRLGMFDDPYCGPSKAESLVHTQRHIDLAKRVADESVILLENNGLLPLDASKLKSVAVIGPNSDFAVFGDYGWVRPDRKYGVSLLDGMRDRLPKGITLNHAEGCDWWSTDTTGIAAAVDAALRSDVSIVAVGTRSFYLGRDAKSAKPTSGEGFDLSDLELPGAQLQLLKAIKATGKPMAVVLITGKPLVMDYAGKNADALLVQFYGGEQQGNALADVLLGNVNPSGRLNVSFPRSTGNTPCYYNYLKGDRIAMYDKCGAVDDPGGRYVFDTPGPLWAFGHGRSYTTYSYSDMKVDSDNYAATDTINISVNVTNTGTRAGKETVQLYVSDLVSSIVTPEHELRAFDKVEIQPGETRTVNFALPVSDLALYGADKCWKVEPGQFELQIGPASDNIALRHTITVR